MKFDNMFIEDFGQVTDGMFGDGQQTTQALGEEDDASGGVTSCAVGEEDGSAPEYEPTPIILND